MLPPFQADTDQIEMAASRMGGVSGVLDVGYGHVDPGALGFPSAQAALAQFVASWTVAGSELSKAAALVQRALTGSADSYSKAETSSTVRPGTPIR